MDILLVPFLNVIYIVLSMMSWMIVAHIILSWLIMFGILNLGNSFIYAIVSFLSRFVEMLVRPLRGIIPVVAGFDFAILVLLLLIYFIQGVVARILIRFVLV